MPTKSEENRVVIVMGVSGSGKSTVGRLVADGLASRFLDADDFHSADAIEKMRQSVPLTADDRKPWIDSLVARLNAEPDDTIVLACSALTHAIRQRFRAEVHASVTFVYLKLAYAQLATRLRQRTGHYAKEGLLESQMDTLEEPHPSADAIIIDVRTDETPAEVSARALTQLQA